MSQELFEYATDCLQKELLKSNVTFAIYYSNGDTSQFVFNLFKNLSGVINIHYNKNSKENPVVVYFSTATDYYSNAYIYPEAINFIEKILNIKVTYSRDAVWYFFKDKLMSLTDFLHLNKDKLIKEGLIFTVERGGSVTDKSVKVGDIVLSLVIDTPIYVWEKTRNISLDNINNLFIDSVNKFCDVLKYYISSDNLTESNGRRMADVYIPGILLYCPLSEKPFRIFISTEANIDYNINIAFNTDFTHKVLIGNENDNSKIKEFLFEFEKYPSLDFSDPLKEVETFLERYHVKVFRHPFVSNNLNIKGLSLFFPFSSKKNVFRNPILEGQLEDILSLEPKEITYHYFNDNFPGSHWFLPLCESTSTVTNRVFYDLYDEHLKYSFTNTFYFTKDILSYYTDRYNKFIADVSKYI